MTGGLLFTLAFSAMAQSSSKAAIPFDFQIGDSVLKAGVYTITAPISVNPELLMFRDSAGKSQSVHNGTRMEAADNGPAHLQFTKYGDRYFLSQVWIHVNETGTEVQKGKAERALATDYAQHAAVRDNNQHAAKVVVAITNANPTSIGK
jgi:hypothetical protein